MLTNLYPETRWLKFRRKENVKRTFSATRWLFRIKFTETEALFRT